MADTMKKAFPFIFLVALLWFIPPTADVRVVVSSKATGKAVTIFAEVADTLEKRMTGLMHRTDLAPDQGMWFVFDTENFTPFWMKNTPTSLDIIFVGSDLRIIDIARRTQPYSLAPNASTRPYSYVLEVPTGLADKLGLSRGDQLTVARAK